MCLHFRSWPQTTRRSLSGLNRPAWRSVLLRQLAERTLAVVRLRPNFAFFRIEGIEIGDGQIPSTWTGPVALRWFGFEYIPYLLTVHFLVERVLNESRRRIQRHGGGQVFPSKLWACRSSAAVRRRGIGADVEATCRLGDVTDFRGETARDLRKVAMPPEALLLLARPLCGWAHATFWVVAPTAGCDSWKRCQ